MDPYMDIPKTDEDVKDLVVAMYDDSFVQRNVLGIYRCQRGLGKDVLGAWEYTLQAVLKIFNKKGESDEATGV